MNRNIEDSELLEECIYIYDGNMDALVLHIYKLFLTGNKVNISKTKIFNDLTILPNKKALKLYRSKMIKVMDSFKDEVDEFILLTKFDIRGLHEGVLYCNENIDSVKKLDRQTLSRMKKELVKIIYGSERLLKEIKNVN